MWQTQLQLYDQTELWNIKGLWYRVAKIRVCGKILMGNNFFKPNLNLSGYF